MSLIVLPYLGARAARSELTRPAPAPAHDPSRPLVPAPGDPLHGLNMRLTYRTMRVLAAVAEQPGASNREIAEHAEIIDQGQVSKLLSRLSERGLVENFGAGQRRGAANAW
jgi:predicted HTH transcriptional regulator